MRSRRLVPRLENVTISHAAGSYRAIWAALSQVLFRDEDDERTQQVMAHVQEPGRI